MAKLCMHAAQILAIPDDMEYYGRGPLLAAKELDLDVLWARARQIQSVCEQARALTLPLASLQPRTADPKDRAVGALLLLCCYGPSAAGAACKLSFCLKRHLQTCALLIQADTSSGPCDLGHSPDGAPVDANIACVGGWRPLSGKPLSLLVLPDQDAEVLSVAVTDANSGGLLATLCSLPAFLPFSLMIKEDGASWHEPEARAAQTFVGSSPCLLLCTWNLHKTGGNAQEYLFLGFC
jgi:hypothetical protein